MGETKAKQSGGREMKGESMAAVRATISFPADLYSTLGEIAREKKVSLAWVVREAVEKYIADKWPLFHENQ
jgi:metal-responsive CopG/Arc/MetJ family transcriptional regulator